MKRTWLYIIVILILSIIVYHTWFIPNIILTHGDFGFSFIETDKENLLTFPLLWSPGSFGTVNLNITMLPKFLISGLLAHFNFAPHLNVQITYLWPIVIISSLGVFLLGRKVLNSNIGGFISSLAFCFSVITIGNRTGHLTLATAYAIAPLVVLSLIETLERKKIEFAIVTALLGYIVSFNEFRAFYILAWIMIFYSVFFVFIIERNRRGLIKSGVLVGFLFSLILLLNSYLFLGLKFSFSSTEASGFLNRGLFGNSFANILISFSSWNPWWTGEELKVFVMQPIPMYFWLIPISAFSGLMLNKRNKNILFFGVLSLLGILLTKQSGVPFPNLYQWLYDNFPGFIAFREASKFYFLIALGYSILIGSFVDWLFNNWKKGKWQVWGKYLFTLLILLIFLGNTKPLINEKIGSLFVLRHIPKDYLIFKDFILKQPGFFRTLWVPVDSRWGIYTVEHPKVGLVQTLNTKWQDFLDPDKYENLPGRERIMSILKQPFSPTLLNISSIKYVVVPIRDQANDDDFFIHYGKSREFYTGDLDKLNYLKTIDLNTEELAVYENKNFHEHFYIPKKITSINGKPYHWAQVTSLSRQPDNPVTYFSEEKSDELSSRADEIFLVGKPIKPSGDYLIWNKGWAWPEVNVNPDSFKYKLVLLKEWHAEKSNRDYLGKVDVTLWHAAKRAEELKHFEPKNKELLIKSFEKKLGEITKALRNIPADKRDENYLGMVSKVLAYTKRSSDLEFPGAQEIYENFYSWLTTETHLDCLNYCYEVNPPKEGKYIIFVNREELLKNNSASDPQIKIGGVISTPDKNQKDEPFLSFKEVTLDKKEVFNLILQEPKNLIAQESWQPVPWQQKAWYKKISDWEGNQKYKLTLKYPSLEEDLGVAIIENGERGENAEELPLGTTTFKQVLPRMVGEEEKNLRQTFEAEFRSAPASKSGYLLIWGVKSFKLLEDPKEKTIKIQKIIFPTIIFKNTNREKETGNGKQPTISYKSVNPTKYIISVTGAENPYDLVFNENFHDGWKLYIKESNVGSNIIETWGKNPISEDTHYLANGYANAWYIKPEDVNGKRKYDLILEFNPQKWVYIGLSLSLLIFWSCLVYLGIRGAIFIFKRNKC